MSDRIVQICDKCNEIDDHFRHKFADAQGTYPVKEELVKKIVESDFPSDVKTYLLSQAYDTTEACLHAHCCREDGCKECAKLPDELSGLDLVAHIQAQGA